MEEAKIRFKTNLYIYSIVLFSIAFSLIIGYLGFKGTHSLLFGIIEAILIFIPISEIYIKILQYVLAKCVKPKLIPKMDFSISVPTECRTMIVIPFVVKTAEDVRNIFNKLEVYFLANKSKNIFCTALADPVSMDKEICENDRNIIQAGLDEVERLNKKYQGFQKDNIFNFVYRKRLWNNNEHCYMGWERKRGFLTELTNFLQKRKFNFTFAVNTLEKADLNIKYVITLDEDTVLTLNSGIELIEAMAHPLNKPEVEDGKVKEGYGVIAPRVGVNLETNGSSIFSEIFSGGRGVDSYTNAISDIYQDNFEEGSYAGKGIYDAKVFCDVMNDKIPENTVLSHDLLEGCYLRCGLASDVMLLDNYPNSYLSFLTRLNRWIRGDYQILRISW